jgi:hypothetical protein
MNNEQETEPIKKESKIKKRIKKILIVLGIILIVFIGVEFISAAKYKSGGEEQKIDFHLDIPISADKEKYQGRVFIFRLPRI